MSQVNRRAFLKGGAGVAAGGALLGGPFQGLAAAASQSNGRPQRFVGELRPVADLRDGVARLHLPEGFEYRSFNVAGSPMSNGTPTPEVHDGMAAFHGHGRNSILVRNHEINGPDGAFGNPDKAYDPITPGGTVTLEVTPFGEVVRSEVSLNGTQRNCSGGPMPWASWVTCEETVNGPDVGPDFTGQPNDKLQKQHGFIFDVPAHDADNDAARNPIRKAGRFPHEAALFDPRTGAVYLTEDNFGYASGFYRYIPPEDPRKVGHLLDGGRLQMLAVSGQPNAPLHEHQRPGATYDVTWVDIPEPDPTFGGDYDYALATKYVGDQGRERGAAQFSRLEGQGYAHGVVYFVSTQGGAQVTDAAPSGFGNGRGQVWAYHTPSATLQLIYESPGPDVLDFPDNVTASSRGSLVLCEDGDIYNFLRGLDPRGNIFDLARTDFKGAGELAPHEFCGSTFSTNGKTLFVNLQSPNVDAEPPNSMSVAIWGPWHRAGF